jgi:oxygen-independent coproporphyrinogen-3 oxidase
MHQSLRGPSDDTRRATPRFDGLFADPDLLARYDAPRPRYTSYPTAVDFTSSVTNVDYAARLQQLGRSLKSVSLYVHLPFCESRCTYCACNVTVSRRPEHVGPAYIDRVLEEARRVRAHLGRRPHVSQLHLGGGTPTFHAPEELERLVRGLAEVYEFGPDFDGSVEIDPRVTSVRHLEVLAACGFRRVSMGVQDLDSGVQEAIGRVQSFEQTEELVRAARALGFDSVNFDLVYGLPRQTRASFGATLEAVRALAPDRLAVYGFAFLPEQVRHQRSIDPSEVPGAALRLELALQARSFFLENGWEAIGFDHFALPGDGLVEARREGTLGRTFMGYTETSTHDWIGLGASAISFVQEAYFQNASKLGDWQRAVDAGELAVARGVLLDLDDRERAWVIREWMCNGQIDRRRWRSTWGTSFDRHYASEIVALKRQWPELIEDDGTTLRLTELGEIFVRNVAQTFDARHPPRNASWRGASGI